MLIAITGGIVAAMCFTVAALCASSSSREIGAASTLAWAMTIGLCLVIVPLAIVGHPGNLRGRTIGLLAVAGIANVIGLLIEYAVMRHVAVGVVTAIASTEGMVAAVLSSIFGAALSASTVVLLVAITAGVVLAAAHLEPSAASTPGGPGADLASRSRRFDRTLTRWSLLLIPVALLFGLTLYCIGRAGTQAPVIWVLLPARLFGTIFLAAPLASRRRLQITRRTSRLVAGAGAGEVLGLVCYTFAARHQLAVAAVLASQSAAITPVAGFFLFGERLRRHQVAGIVIVVAGVVSLSALGV